jgi:hypothetical protein
MFVHIILSVVIFLCSGVALATSSFCFTGAVTVGSIGSETAKNFRKLLRFEMQEFVEVMDEDGDCDYEAQGFIIQNGDQFRVGVRILSEGVREKTVATLIDEESEISTAARLVAKKLAKWDEDSSETAEVRSQNTMDARIKVQSAGYNTSNVGFEFGVGVGPQRGLNLNIAEALSEQSAYFRLDHGYYALRLDYAESFYDSPVYEYQYEFANRSIGIGGDLFAFSSGISPYLGISLNFQQTNYPEVELSESMHDNTDEFLPSQFTGMSASARLGLTVLRLKSVPFRLGAETEYRLVPTPNQDEYSGFGAAKLLLSLMPGQILGS